jgi:DNA-binding protein HU-beta
MAGKADILDHVVDAVEGLSKKQAGEAFDAVFESITAQLKKGERVQVGNFGSFSVTERAARKGRNPATKAVIHIPASKNVRFKPATSLKGAVNKKRK